MHRASADRREACSAAPRVVPFLRGRVRRTRIRLHRTQRHRQVNARAAMDAIPWRPGGEDPLAGTSRSYTSPSVENPWSTDARGRARKVGAITGTLRLPASACFARHQLAPSSAWPPADASETIVRQCYIPRESPVGALTVLRCIDRVLAEVPVWAMGCDISETAVKTSFEAMTGQSYAKVVRKQ